MRCSNKCAKPLFPLCSSRAPTSKSMVSVTTGRVWSSESTTRKPLASVNWVNLIWGTAIAALAGAAAGGTDCAAIIAARQKRQATYLPILRECHDIPSAATGTTAGRSARFLGRPARLAAAPALVRGEERSDLRRARGGPGRTGTDHRGVVAQRRGRAVPAASDRDRGAAPTLVRAAGGTGGARREPAAGRGAKQHLGAVWSAAGAFGAEVHPAAACGRASGFRGAARAARRHSIQERAAAAGADRLPRARNGDDLGGAARLRTERGRWLELGAGISGHAGRGAAAAREADVGIACRVGDCIRNRTHRRRRPCALARACAGSGGSAGAGGARRASEALAR